ncbi:MAG: CoA pyrophosphatase [Boseongicola sp. SB0677_bin_26]|nr:CoA pyrophosphatase [Boseongicola sp. SB0665_bin_10]MYG24638.1 CoA pyrophosphatase [Boseongicola sp. SB0677_bin_26]
MADLAERLRSALAAASLPSSDYDLNPDTQLSPERTLRGAAVLIPVVDRPANASVILTKRSSALKHHPGQIAFPGGKVDETDDGVVDAALREAREEIGLHRRHADVLGALPPHETVTGFLVTPVLAMVTPEFMARPDPGEVAEAFEVPLDHVTNPARFLIESRRWRGERRFYFVVPWGPYYIWGATARILRALADRMPNAET